jgi:hypothetical protein
MHPLPTPVVLDAGKIQLKRGLGSDLKGTGLPLMLVEGLRGVLHSQSIFQGNSPLGKMV